MSSHDKYKLIYFDSTGFGEPIRYLFALAGVPFENQLIAVEPKREIPDEIKKELPWGQVPILYVNGKGLTQSSAILRYLARKFGFAGESEFDSGKIDEYVDATKDFIEQLRGIFGEDDLVKRAEKKKELCTVYAPTFFTRMEKNLKENGGQYLVGTKLSWADVYLVNWIEIFEVVHLRSDIKSKYPLVKDLYDRFHKLPQIVKWRAEHPYTDPLMTGEKTID